MGFCFGRLSSVFVGFEILFFWYCLPKTGGSEGLPNHLLPELEDFAKFGRILVLTCFSSDNLVREPRFRV